MKAVARNKVMTTNGDATVTQSIHEGWLVYDLNSNGKVGSKRWKLQPAYF